MKHLRDSQIHKNGKNPVNVKSLIEFLAFNKEGHKL
jgi:hypothetical protein